MFSGPPVTPQEPGWESLPHKNAAVKLIDKLEQTHILTLRTHEQDRSKNEQKNVKTLHRSRIIRTANQNKYLLVCSSFTNTEKKANTLQLHNRKRMIRVPLRLMYS
jgi:hypothetical protein